MSLRGQAVYDAVPEKAVTVVVTDGDREEIVLAFAPAIAANARAVEKEWRRMFGRQMKPLIN